MCVICACQRLRRQRAKEALAAKQKAAAQAAAAANQAALREQQRQRVVQEVSPFCSDVS
eukprot:COSAG01_NODE_2771_length_7101_cov_12.982148_3_plen_59_part_00